MPLVLPIQVVCNVADEEIYGNIRVNSKARGDWLKTRPEHKGIAILCGSGPSLADTLEEIREMEGHGGIVFALNGAAKYLADNGIMPDYQVLIDARERTADLVGPAREHLFASQVHPECFRRAPAARLWHLQVGNIENEFPDYEDEYCLIGGAASVGNTATCLAYAMGYRAIHCFGYDSCHRDGQGHAFHQSINDGDPCAVVKFNGKEYTASLTMKLQAERFMETSRALQACGATVIVHGSGLLPDMWTAPREVLDEAEKYERMWAQDEYRLFSPGEKCVDTFLDLVKPKGTVIDLGCGTGRAALKIRDYGCPVILVDLVENSRDPMARQLPFVKCDLRQPVPLGAPYGFCADVMEHVPTDDVRAVIRNIMIAAETVFFQICTVPDQCGESIGQVLHLTVRPHEWWREVLSEHAEVTWEQPGDINSLFLAIRREV